MKRLAEMEIDCAQASQPLRQQDDNVVGPGGVVAGQVLPLQVSVHGHLGASASAHGRYEVYGRLAAATLYERYGLRGNDDVHRMPGSTFGSLDAHTGCRGTDGPVIGA